MTAAPPVPRAGRLRAAGRLPPPPTPLPGGGKAGRAALLAGTPLEQEGSGEPALCLEFKAGQSRRNAGFHVSRASSSAIAQQNRRQSQTQNRTAAKGTYISFPC